MTAADLEEARGDGGREHRIFYRMRPAWAGHLASAALILSVAAIGATLLFTRLIDHDEIPAAAILVVVFAVVLGAFVGVARWSYAALAGRVDILTQALDASPDPQLILAPDGRITYANTAYRELFPLAHEHPIPAIAAALVDPDAM